MHSYGNIKIVIQQIQTNVYISFYREVHHMCVLLGYGADAICPYLVLEMAKSLREEGVLDSTYTDKVVYEVISMKYLSLVLLTFYSNRVI